MEAGAGESNYMSYVHVTEQFKISFQVNLF